MVPLKANCYDHWSKTRGEGDSAAIFLPRVHQVSCSLIWLTGTYHGVGREHSPHVLRSNRRPTLMAAFQTLLCLVDQHIPTTHKMLYAGEPTG